MSDPYQQIIQTLSRCKRVLVTTHVKPDGDALGSTAALVMAMQRKGIEAKVVLLSHLPKKYSFVYLHNQIPCFDVEDSWPADFDLDDYDAIVVADTGTWSQLPGMQERIEKWPRPKIVIDHHLTQQDWADIKLVDTTAGACGEIVEELLLKWGVELNPAIATALFLAIVADTGWFMYSNTRPVTLRLAAKLMDVGVDTNQVYQLLYQNERPERIALHARTLHSLQLLAGGKLAVMQIRKEDFAATSSHVNDTEDLINFPLQIRNVNVSILFVEPPTAGPIRISFRSKGQVDVAAFAQQFGGGGHARAAGLKLEEPFESARDKVINAMVTMMGNHGD